MEKVTPACQEPQDYRYKHFRKESYHPQSLPLCCPSLCPVYVLLILSTFSLPPPPPPPPPLLLLFLLCLTLLLCLLFLLPLSPYNSFSLF